jgi:hypothetical protein
VARSILLYISTTVFRQWSVSCMHACMHSSEGYLTVSGVGYRFPCVPVRECQMLASKLIHPRVWRTFRGHTWP